MGKVSVCKIAIKCLNMKKIIINDKQGGNCNVNNLRNKK